MKLNRIFRKPFFVTLFLRQNKYHKYGVLLHTIGVFINLLKAKEYKMLPAALLHDIGKPLIAHQTKEDILNNEYSFHNHEEISYKIIRNWNISTYTKNLVRYHYLLRNLEKTLQKKQISKHNRLKKIYNKLDKNFIKDLKTFMIFDDIAKTKIF